MLSLWANWLQLNSQLNSPGVSFWLYRMYVSIALCWFTKNAYMYTRYMYINWIVFVDDKLLWKTKVNAYLWHLILVQTCAHQFAAEEKKNWLDNEIVNLSQSDTHKTLSDSEHGILRTTCSSISSAFTTQRKVVQQTFPISPQDGAMRRRPSTEWVALKSHACMQLHMYAL